MVMKYGEIDKPSQEIKTILNILNTLFEQADEDCPSEHRSHHLRTALTEAEDLLIKYKIRVRN